MVRPPTAWLLHAGETPWPHRAPRHGRTLETGGEAPLCSRDVWVKTEGRKSGGERALCAARRGRGREWVRVFLHINTQSRNWAHMGFTDSNGAQPLLTEVGLCKRPASKNGGIFWRRLIDSRSGYF